MQEPLLRPSPRFRQWVDNNPREATGVGIVLGFIILCLIIIMGIASWWAYDVFKNKAPTDPIAWIKTKLPQKVNDIVFTPPVCEHGVITGGQCICNADYYDHKCSTKCVNGTYKDNKCQCDVAFGGPTCEIPCDRGTLKDGVCQCDSGWTGKACNVMDKQDASLCVGSDVVWTGGYSSEKYKVLPKEGHCISNRGGCDILEDISGTKAPNKLYCSKFAAPHVPIPDDPNLFNNIMGDILSNTQYIRTGNGQDVYFNPEETDDVVMYDDLNREFKQPDGSMRQSSGFLAGLGEGECSKLLKDLGCPL
jgi:hypothetical protein